MVGTDWRSVAVAEVNAFGDLLPGLTGLPGSGAEGLDTYGAQVRAVLSGWRGPGAEAGSRVRILRAGREAETGQGAETEAGPRRAVRAGAEAGT
ncbi:hypothetical protein [Planomonospora algeriensis]